MFITFEGGEGAGKSTQARLLVEALAEAGFSVLPTREPGGAPGSEALRALLLGGAYDWSPCAEIYLHFAARVEHLARTVQPALAAGTVVVCDRFADSTMAYQGYGLGGDRHFIAMLTRALPVRPELTIMLQVSPDAAALRLATRPARPDRYEALDAGFHARVAQGFAEIAAADPHRCVVVDGEAEMEAVHQAVRRQVARRLAGFA